MLTPAQRHRIKVEAAQQAAATPDNAPQTSEISMLMRAALAEDRRRLHDIQSIERKIEVKAQLLPHYQPYIDGVLESGTGAADEVISTMMIWHLDCGDFPRALEIAEYVLSNNLPAPDAHKRTPATILAEEMADAALRAHASNAEPMAIDPLLNAYELTANADMPDQVRAKLNKALGFAHRDSNQPERALQHLQRALELDSKSGVKTEITKLEKQLKESAG